MLAKATHWRYCAEDLKGEDGTCRGRQSFFLCEFGFVLFFFNSKTKYFFVLTKRKYGFAIREQLHRLLHGNGAFNNDADVSCWVWNKPNPLDAAHWFITYLYSSHIASVISSNTLYTM